MGRVVAVLVILAVAWFGYSRFDASRERLAAVQAVVNARAERGRPARLAAPPAAAAPMATTPTAQPAFECNGRTRCTQVTSCAEATFVSQHCPGAQMDGDHDGIPCEQQWCY